MVEKRIGEIVIRTPNMQKMAAFYQEVIDLEPFKMSGTTQFLKVSRGSHKRLVYLNWAKFQT
jgi:catechol-2,3-dioxygenase